MRPLELRTCDGVTFRAHGGVTSRDGVTLGPRNDVTSDVIGRLAPKIPRPLLVNRIENSAPAQRVDLPVAHSELEQLIGQKTRFLAAKCLIGLKTCPPAGESPLA